MRFWLQTLQNGVLLSTVMGAVLNALRGSAQMPKAPQGASPSGCSSRERGVGKRRRVKPLLAL